LASGDLNAYQADGAKPSRCPPLGCRFLRLCSGGDHYLPPARRRFRQRLVAVRRYCLPGQPKSPESIHRRRDLNSSQGSAEAVAVPGSHKAFRAGDRVVKLFRSNPRLRAGISCRLIVGRIMSEPKFREDVSPIITGYRFLL